LAELDAAPERPGGWCAHGADGATAGDGTGCINFLTKQALRKQGMDDVM
jgi:hypothetical protein